MRKHLFSLASLLAVVVMASIHGLIASADAPVQSPQPYWGRPVTLFEGEGPSDVMDALISPNGTSYVFWVDSSAYPYTRSLVMRSRPPGGAWSPTIKVAGDAAAVNYSRTVVDRQGSVHVRWAYFAGEGNALRYRTITPTGVMSPIMGLPGCYGEELAIAPGPGSLIYFGCGGRSVLRKDGDTLHEMYSMPEQFPILLSRYAVDGNGLLHVVYYRQDSDDIFYRTTDGLTFWSAPVNVSNNPTWSSAPQLGMDNAGNVHVVWEDQVGPTTRHWFLRSLKNGTWTSAQDITLPGTKVGDFESLNLRVSADGTVHLVHVKYPGQLQYRSMSPSGVWSAVGNLSGVEMFVVSDKGTAHFLVNDRTNTDPLPTGIPYHHFRTVDGKWSSPVEIPGRVAFRRGVLTIKGEDALLAAWGLGDPSYGQTRILSTNYSTENLPTPTPTATPKPTATPTPNRSYLPRVTR